MLYLGPFIFLDVLDEQYYDNFIKLHAAIRILCDPKRCRTENHIAANLLVAFANEFIMIYKPEYFVYNFHVLTHLPEDCKRFGALDSFSAFPFENYMQTILRSIKKAPQPLRQFRNRLLEQMKFTKSHEKEVIREKGIYSKITNNRNIVISTDGNDNFVGRGNCIYRVKKIVRICGNFVLTCQKIVDLMFLYDDPMDSRTLGVYCTDSAKYCEYEEEIFADFIDKVLHIKLDGIEGFLVILHTRCEQTTI